MNDLLAVKDDLSADGLALEHASRKFNFLLLVVGQVPLIALPEQLARLSIFHLERLDAKLAL